MNSSQDNVPPCGAESRIWLPRQRTGECAGRRWWLFQQSHDEPPPPLVRVAPHVFVKRPKRLLRLGPAFLLLVLAARLLILGAYPLVDPSESRYAEMARKMLETGNWVTPQIDYGVPFWGKPPLAVWLNAICLNLFGVNEFASRLSALLLGAGVVWIVYRLAATRGGQQAFAAPAMLAGMALFFVMAGSVAMDQALALGVALTMAAFWLAMRHDSAVYRYGFFIGLSVGLMAKGPVAVVLTGLPIGLWTLLRKEWLEVWRRLPWVKGTALMLVLSVPWYLIAEQRTPGFLEYFFIGEHWKRFTEPGWQGDLYGSGRAHAKGTIWVYWLSAALPWSPLFLAVVGVAWRRRQLGKLLASADGWRLYCLLWMLSPMLFFTVSANVIWTYVLPGLPGCALLLAEWRREGRLDWLSSRGLTMVCAALVPGLFLAAVLAWQFAPFQFVRTQKPLIDAYYQLRTDSGQHLYYVWDNPFSAQFYTQGQARQIHNVEEFQSLLEQPGQDFFVCPKKAWADMPEFIRDRLQNKGVYNGFILLQHVATAEP